MSAKFIANFFAVLVLIQYYHTTEAANPVIVCVSGYTFYFAEDQSQSAAAHAALQYAIVPHSGKPQSGYFNCIYDATHPEKWRSIPVERSSCRDQAEKDRLAKFYNLRESYNIIDRRVSPQPPQCNIPQQ